MASILNSLSKITRKDIVMSVRDIKKTFVEAGQPLKVLHGGGFDLYRGEIVALVGQSGSGKTTFLKSIKMGLFGCYSLGLKNETSQYWKEVEEL